MYSISTVYTNCLGQVYSINAEYINFSSQVYSINTEYYNFLINSLYKPLRLSVLYKHSLYKLLRLSVLYKHSICQLFRPSYLKNTAYTNCLGQVYSINTGNTNWQRVGQSPGTDTGARCCMQNPTLSMHRIAYKYYVLNWVNKSQRGVPWFVNQRIRMTFLSMVTKADGLSLSVSRE